jgi:hypothetical protein
VNVCDVWGDWHKGTYTSIMFKHWQIYAMQLQTQKCQYYTVDTSIIKNALTFYCLWCLYIVVCIHTSISEFSDPKEESCEGGCTLLIQAKISHTFVSQKFQAFYTLQCVAVCTVLESIKIICNIHYIVYTFVSVISNTVLMHRMNKSKPVILNL